MGGIGQGGVGVGQGCGGVGGVGGVWVSKGRVGVGVWWVG